MAEAAGVSTRTLYKHVGSKTALVAAVLEDRGNRLCGQLNVPSVDALFAALEDWTIAMGARGCLFLRADRETGGAVPEISEVVGTYRRNLRSVIGRVIAHDIGQRGDDVLAEQILVLFEGAVSAATYRGVEAVRAARTAAAVLVKQHPESIAQ